MENSIVIVSGIALFLLVLLHHCNAEIDAQEQFLAQYVAQYERIGMLLDRVVKESIQRSGLKAAISLVKMRCRSPQDVAGKLCTEALGALLSIIDRIGE